MIHTSICECSELALSAVLWLFPLWHQQTDLLVNICMRVHDKPDVSHIVSVAESELSRRQ